MLSQRRLLDQTDREKLEEDYSERHVSLAEELVPRIERACFYQKELSFDELLAHLQCETVPLKLAIHSLIIHARLGGHSPYLKDREFKTSDKYYRTVN